MNNNALGEITIEILPSLHVACFRSVSLTPEGDSTQTVSDWLKQNNINETARIFGFDTETTPEEAQAGKRGYETWMTVPPEIKPSNGISIQDFKGGLYATMTLVRPFDNPFETIPNGWKVLHEWVISSEQYQGANHQWLEELIVHPDGNDLKLYHPVVSRA